ncbi:MAG: MMPL family transporter [Chitinophagales bacterium]|nr:MMPL family transporter [Chitinophagales bacterium]
MFSGIIIKYRWLIVVTIGIMTAIAVSLLPKLTTDVDFSNFFPEGDSEVAYYKDFIERMGSNDHFIAIAIVPGKSVFDNIFLSEVEDLRKSIETLKHISSASAITSISRYIKTPTGIISLPYINLANNDRLTRDSVIIHKEYEITQSYISDDSKCVIVLLQLERDIGQPAMDLTVTLIENLIEEHNFNETHLMGKKLVEIHYQRLIEDELKRSIILTIGVIILLLYIYYRSVSGVLLPLSSMIIALVLLYGFLALSGRSLGIMSSLFPTIILIVGISDSIHIITKYKLESGRLSSQTEAIRIVIREVGLSIGLTSLTTIFGFLTLTTSKTPALKNFGIDASIGILIAFIISILLIPAVLSILPFKWYKIQSLDILKWDWLSGKIYEIAIHQKKRILFVILICLVLSGYGISEINTNNLQIKNIPKDHRLKTDYRFFEEQLGGSRSLELAIEMKGNASLSDPAVIAEIRKLHVHLQQDNSFRNVISPVTWYHWISKVFDRSLPPLEVPDSEEKIRNYEKRISGFRKNSNWKVVDESGKFGRITAKTVDSGRKEIQKMNEKLNRWITNEIDTSNISFRFVGMDLMIDRGHEHRINNMIWGILIALIAVALLIGILFRSYRMVWITLIANTIPLILIAGLMGFTGVELRGTTSIIFTIGFVIAVDDTIHFLSRFKIERSKGFSVKDSVRITLLETGKAIITTSILLFSGFIVLLSSSFGDVFIVGFLVSAMILFALLADLFLVPLLLISLLKDKQE